MDNITYGYKSCITLFEDNNEFYMAFITTLMFSVLSTYMYLTYNSNKKNISNDSSNGSSNGIDNYNKNISSNIDINAKNTTSIKIIKKPILLKGLYLESIQEINEQGKAIIAKISEGKTYWALIRVQMRNFINMSGTVSDLQSNYVIGNTNKAFQTRDMYMIFRFKPLKNYNTHNLFGIVIVQFMNYLNHLSDKKFHTNDFIVCAIGSLSSQTNESSATLSQIENLEFLNGLKYIDYKMENYIKINAPLNVTIDQYNRNYNENNNVNNNGNDNINCIRYNIYSLMLPIHNIYDLFMDVYNECIFESKKYIIDDNNYESWNNKSINEYQF
jgi:hypothetical protein